MSKDYLRKGRCKDTLSFNFDDNGILREISFTYDRKLPKSLVVDTLKAMIFDLETLWEKQLEYERGAD